MATKKKVAKKKAPVKKLPVKKAPAKKAPAKKATAKKSAPAKKSAAVKSAAKSTAKKAVAARPQAGALQHEVEQFLYGQSEILDTKQWQAYIDLFTADGVYWAPVDPAHTHWDGMPAIFIEDHDLMTVRMKRVKHPNAWSQQAEWCTSHLVSNVVIEKVDANGDIHVRSRFYMSELRRDDLRHFSGTYRHHLKRTREGLKIKLQRTDLMNAQAPFEYVLQIWV